MQITKLAVVGIVALLVVGMSAPAEGKRRRPVPPLTILRVTTAPTPFQVGAGPLTLTVTVKLPRTARKTQVLEVSSLIASPSRRSVRFLSQRWPIHSIISRANGRVLQITLEWDGTDQTRHYVPSGLYQYDIRAKLLEDRGNGFQVKLVSRHARGAIEVMGQTSGESQSRGKVFEPLDAAEVGDEPPLEDLTEEEALQEDQADQPDEETLDKTPLAPGLESSADGQDLPEGDQSTSFPRTPDVTGENPQVLQED